MKFLRMPLLATLIALSPIALAHGDAIHAKPAETAVERHQQAWGIAGDGAMADREIVIRMTDEMRFVPDRITVREGETIRFVHRNDGAVMHEMVIGTRAALEEHAEIMTRFPGMEHDEPWMAHIAPGGEGEIVWTFNRAGNFEFGCLIPGHFQAGMKGTILVGEAGGAARTPAGKLTEK
jgi:uncharacterized cupredoxin-like copper-binding protein